MNGVSLYAQPSPMIEDKHIALKLSGACFAVILLASVLLVAFPQEYHLFLLIYSLNLLVHTYPLLRSHPFDWFEPPVFWCLFSVISLYRPLYLILYQDFQTDFLPELSQEESLRLGVQVLLFQMLTRLFYYLGYYSQAAKQWGVRWPALPNEWDWRRLSLVLIAGTVACLVCFFVVVSIAGGPVNYFYNLNYWRREMARQGLETLRRALSFFPFIGMLWYVYHLTQQRSLYFWFFLFSTFVVSASIGSRSFVIIPLCGMLVLAHYLGKRLSPFKIALFAAGALVFVVVMQEYRQVTGNEELGSSSSAARVEVVTARSYHPLDIINEAVRDRRSFDEQMYRVHTTKIPHDLLFGKTYLYYLIAPIPRLLWPGKIEIGFATKPNVIKGMPSGFFGELFQNFYIPGVVIGFFLWGICHKALYAWLQAHRTNKSVIMLYMVTLIWLPAPDRLAILTWLPIFLPMFFLLRFLAHQEQQAVPISSY